MLALVLAQVFLPRIAASRISSTVGAVRDGGEREREGVAGGEAAVGERRFGEGEGGTPEAEPGADGEAAVGSAGV